MEDAIKQGQLFLSELTAEERSCLYNDLLSLKDVYLCNKDTSFYTFRKIRRATKRCAECRKRTFSYQTEHKGELSISQIHEQKRFKNHYRIQILFNGQEMEYAFLENLLQHLHNEHFSYNSHVIYA
ncbi:hypothetical protein NXO46_001491 [Enterococcus faecium]|nr:hypothetical protein [Enterococcus faecium]EME8069059.1 hypothetical protein [Enterococcus faecium]EMF0350202.1 hypothetical protein [Enterococcus faecium]